MPEMFRNLEEGLLLDESAVSVPITSVERPPSLVFKTIGTSGNPKTLALLGWARIHLND